jgi:starvation-inducible DNA-binding protein
MSGTRIGLTVEARDTSTHMLNVLLADEFIVSMKSLKAHWEVQAVTSGGVHPILLQQLALSTALIADLGERVCDLGGSPCATATEVLRHTTLLEDSAPFESAHTAVNALCADHEAQCRSLRTGLAYLRSTESEDAGTIALMTRALAEHEASAGSLFTFIDGVTRGNGGAE